MHFHVYKIIDINIFFRPEEAMFENWQNIGYCQLHKHFCIWLDLSLLMFG